jgi:hypothetical protein
VKTELVRYFERIECELDREISPHAAGASFPRHEVFPQISPDVSGIRASRLPCPHNKYAF